MKSVLLTVKKADRVLTGYIRESWCFLLDEVAAGQDWIGKVSCADTLSTSSSVLYVKKKNQTNKVTFQIPSRVLKASFLYLLDLM